MLTPGLRFLHEGQRSGRRVRTSNHLRRRIPEPVDRDMESFYERLLECMQRPEARHGDWRLLDRQPAWDGNPTWERFIAFSWSAGERRLLVVVNYAPSPAQGFVRLPWSDLDGRTWVFADLMAPTVRYERDGSDLARRGLYLDVPAWGRHVFAVAGPEAGAGL